MACKETIMSCAFAWRAIERQNNKVMDSSTQPRNTEGTASLWIYIRKPLPLSIIRSTVSIGNTLSLHLGSRPDKAYSDYSGAICIVFSLNTSNCWFLFLNPTSQYKWLSWEERCSIMFQLSRLPVGRVDKAEKIVKILFSAVLHTALSWANTSHFSQKSASPKKITPGTFQKTVLAF